MIVNYKNSCLIFNGNKFPGGSVVKTLPTAREMQRCRFDPWEELGRSPGEGNGNPLQYPCLKNIMDRGAWRAAVLGVRKELDATEPLNNNWFMFKILFYMYNFEQTCIQSI